MKHKCNKCGTTDCVKENPGIQIEGVGVLTTTSEAILKTCEARRQLKNVKLINPVKNPRYDDVFFEGLDWLDKL